MVKELEDILDACVTAMIEEGATVMECLARYPQWARQLELPLRLTARLAAVAAMQLDPAAKAAGWRRLQAELVGARAVLPDQAPMTTYDSLNIHLSGALEKGSETEWAIASQPIEIAPDAMVTGELRAGAEVAALSAGFREGVFMVSRIIVLS